MRKLERYSGRIVAAPTKIDCIFAVFLLTFGVLWGSESFFSRVLTLASDRACHVLLGKVLNSVGKVFGANRPTKYSNLGLRYPTYSH